MEDGGKLLVTDKQKADAFAKTYDIVSRHVRYRPQREAPADPTRGTNMQDVL